MKKKYLHHLIAIFLIFSSLLIIKSVSAQGGLIPAPSGGGEGDYTLNDFIVLAVNVSQIILGLVGSLSLIMFVYGGVVFILSGGSSEKISQAKKIIVASVVGLIIVFSSWLIIKFAVETLGYEEGFDGTVSALMTNSNLN